MLSQRAQQLASSPTLALDLKVKQMQASGISVVNLGLGEPDFNTPEPIKDAGVAAITNNFSHYTATQGIPELRQAIAQKLTTENHVPCTENQVVVGPGSKFLLFSAFQVLCDPGDEVLIPTPTWSTYLEQVKLAQAKPILVSLKAPFKLTAAELQPYLTARTKVLVLNSPSNPTGAMVDPAELVKIAALAVEKKIWIIADEIYEKMTYTCEHVSIASLSPEVQERTLTINGLSKAYAMTGWRVGYAVGPQAVINAMVSLLGQTTSNTCSIAQKASVAAFTSDQKMVQLMAHEFAQRREVVLTALTAVPRITVTAPEGAFYVFVSLAAVLKEQQTSAQWCQQLLEREHVAVVPGEAFLSPGYFRMSFAASLDTIQSGINTIKLYIEKESST